MVAMGAHGQSFTNTKKRRMAESKESAKSKRRKSEASVNLPDDSLDPKSESTVPTELSAVQLEPMNAPHEINEESESKTEKLSHNVFRPEVKSAKQKLTRFDAENVLDTGTKICSVVSESESEEIGHDHNTDDEAPEALSASAATASSRATVASAEQAALYQRSSAKRRRQEVAARLKQQSESSQKKIKNNKRARNQPMNLEASRTAPTTIDEDVMPGWRNRKIRIPDLLPEDILMEESMRRSPSPPSASRRQRQQLSLTSLHAQKINKSMPIKERIVGPVTVSVLRRTDTLLPPKATGFGRYLKSRWLLQRQGMNGLGSFKQERKNQGFLRK